MLALLGIVGFALLIGLSIALHEVGHLVPAKKFGVKVTEYMIGFGPTLWSRQGKETKYGLKLLPVGGYIKMAGMLPPATKPGGDGRFAQIARTAREESDSEISPGEESRAFYKLTPWKKIVVMTSGPTMNLLLAIILFSIALVGIGLPGASTTLSAALPCIPGAQNPGGEQINGACPTEQSPAALAGLQAGDQILSINGTPVASWEETTTALGDGAGQDIIIVAQRGEQQLSITTRLAQITRTVEGGGTETGGFLGVRPAIESQRQPLSSIPEALWGGVSGTVGALISMPARMYDLTSETLIGGGERAQDSPVSVVGASRLGGQIAELDAPVGSRLATILLLAAGLNLFLFLFNLIPMPPLDGGHVAGAAYESLRRHAARLAGKPDPGYVDVARMIPVAYVSAAILFACGSIVILADLIKPLTIG
jgi:membrane-associated protease RseP (regulator of RpoE activity)